MDAVVQRLAPAKSPKWKGLQSYMLMLPHWLWTFPLCLLQEQLWFHYLPLYLWCFCCSWKWIHFAQVEWNWLRAAVLLRTQAIFKSNYADLGMDFAQHIEWGIHNVQVQNGNIYVNCRHIGSNHYYLLLKGNIWIQILSYYFLLFNIWDDFQKGLRFWWQRETDCFCCLPRCWNSTLFVCLCVCGVIFGRCMCCLFVISCCFCAYPESFYTDCSTGIIALQSRIWKYFYSLFPYYLTNS